MTHLPHHSPTPQAALEDLAAELDPGDFVTMLVTGQGRRPRLTVASRHARLAEDIYADDRAYWWSWAEQIGGIGDPPAAAHKVASVLRITSERASG
jgi:hypothetical protein